MKRIKKEYNRSSAQHTEVEFEIEFPYEPTFDRVIVVPFEEGERSSGGIIIPEAAKRVLNQGEVLKVGIACSFAKVGMFVIFELHTESRITIDGVTFFVLNESNVMAFKNPEMQDDLVESFAQLNKGLDKNLK